MTGPTSEAQPSPERHVCALVEEHNITIRYGEGFRCPDVNAAYAQAKLAAEDWAEAHGLQLDSIMALSRSGEAGVTFTVHVGHGDISDDQRIPGVLDRWRWSARMLWWRKVLNNGEGRQGRILARREDGLASVTELPERMRASGDPKVQAAMGVGVGGCTCHLGGPFAEICPVHFKEDL